MVGGRLSKNISFSFLILFILVDTSLDAAGEKYTTKGGPDIAYTVTRGFSRKK